MSTNSTYPPVQPYSSPPITIVVTILLLAFFFLGFFFVYFCRCFMGNIFTTWNLQPNPNANPHCNSISNGIDRSIFRYFPRFPYSSVKNFCREKYGLECAICLSEFEDNDVLRLLIVCYHVFHQDCIDLWLESHKTCPACRAELNLPENTLEKLSMHCNDNAESNNLVPVREEVTIDVNDGVDNEYDDRRSVSENGVESEHWNDMERFSRSHTTGHSIIKTTEGDDKYQLRLLQHVTMKITRGHHGTESCITFGECSNNAAISSHGYGLGEVSGDVSGAGDSTNKVLIKS